MASGWPAARCQACAGCSTTPMLRPGSNIRISTPTSRRWSGTSMPADVKLHQGRLICAACLIALMAIATPAQGEVNVRDTGKFIIDTADVFQADPQLGESLENVLSQLERKTGAQVKVLTVKNTEGEDIFTFSQRHAERWKLGQKGKNNGALVVLDIGDRKVRVQTGYGLEGALPDAWI